MKARIGLTALLTAVVVLASAGLAAAGKPAGTISVADTTLSASTLSSGMTSHFTASGCGFRAGSNDYFLVVRGPGIGTASLTYWYDAFAVGADGCGSASPSWTDSGVTGSFDVYVVRSGSGTPWQGQLASNVVTVNISSL